MKYDTFDRLATLLCPYIIKSSGKKQTSRNYRHNGAILPEIRLACALHWILGGPIHDVMATLPAYLRFFLWNRSFKCDYEENVCHIRLEIGFALLDAVTQALILIAVQEQLMEFWFGFTSHQSRIASSPDVTPGSSSVAEKKFGLTCQAVCDARDRILDLSIVYPGSSSDGSSEVGRQQSISARIIFIWQQCVFEHALPGNTVCRCYRRNKGCIQFLSFTSPDLYRCTFGMLMYRWAILWSSCSTA